MSARAASASMPPGAANEGARPAAVLLDRDGVLNRDRPDSVRRPEEFELLPGALEAVARLTRAGHRVVVVTNQSVVGRGLATREAIDAIHVGLTRSAEEAGGRIEAIHVCPHAPDAGCDCRKPRPGLLLAAAEQDGVELASAWFVGDRLTDVEAARAAGCRPALVRTGSRPLDGAPLEVPMFDDLGAFAETLLAGRLAAAGGDDA